MPGFRISHKTLTPLLRAEFDNSREFNIATALIKKFDFGGGEFDGCLTRDELDKLLIHWHSDYANYNSSMREMLNVSKGILWVVLQHASVDSTDREVSFKDLLEGAKKRGVDDRTLKLLARVLHKGERKSDFQVSAREMTDFIESIRNKITHSTKNWELSKDGILQGMEKISRSYVALRGEKQSEGVSHRSMLKALKGCDRRNVNVLAEAMLNHDKNWNGQLDKGELYSVMEFIGHSIRIRDKSDFIAGISVAFSKFAKDPCSIPEKDCLD